MLQWYQFIDNYIICMKHNINLCITANFLSSFVVFHIGLSLTEKDFLVSESRMTIYIDNAILCKTCETFLNCCVNVAIW